jgi:hypothetical protein
MWDSLYGVRGELVGHCLAELLGNSRGILLRDVIISRVSASVYDPRIEQRQWLDAAGGSAPLSRRGVAYVTAVNLHMANPPSTFITCTCGVRRLAKAILALETALPKLRSPRVFPRSSVACDQPRVRKVFWHLFVCARRQRSRDRFDAMTVA